MSVILCTREEEQSTLAHGLVLCTQEQAEDYLMHYRVGGEKKGLRRWQDENGRLTEEGYKHYAEMYGWERRLKKAEKLQNKADKASEKAKVDSKVYDESVIKAYKAKNKNEKHTTKRREEKANRLESEVEANKAALAEANLIAEQAKKKASDYADKLQRKEDKISKYVDEKGDLTEEAQNKYAYATPNPGEKRMNLLGRIKFGSEYSKKFNDEHKMKMTKEEYKEWENKEKEKFNTESEQDESLRKFGDDLSKFDKLAKEDQQKTGQKVIDMLEVGEQDYDKLTHDERKTIDGLQDWIWNRIDAKSGNWNTGEFRDNTKGKVAYNDLEYNYEKQRTRYEEIKKEIDYKGDKYIDSDRMNVVSQLNNMRKDSQREKEQSRLERALKNDSIWEELKTNSKKAESDLCGAILQDMGFPDTSANRSLIFKYVFVM